MSDPHINDNNDRSLVFADQRDTVTGAGCHGPGRLHTLSIDFDVPAVSAG